LLQKHVGATVYHVQESEKCRLAKAVEGNGLLLI